MYDKERTLNKSMKFTNSYTIRSANSGYVAVVDNCRWLEIKEFFNAEEVVTTSVLINFDGVPEMACQHHTITVDNVDIIVP